MLHKYLDDLNVSVKFYTELAQLNMCNQ